MSGVLGRTRAHDALGRYTYTYDNAGQTRSITTPAGKRITYSFDAAGQRRAIVEPSGGRFTYTFDDGGGSLRSAIRKAGGRPSRTTPPGA